jgi:hypothetical protein
MFLSRGQKARMGDFTQKEVVVGQITQEGGKCKMQSAKCKVQS